MDSSAVGTMRNSYKLPLSTFRTDRFNIKFPSNRDKMGILDEAIWLMRRHFLHRHLFSDAAWEKLRQECSRYSDPQEAVAALMKTFADPYTRFIPEDVIAERQHVIRGEKGALGLSLRRVWHFARLRAMLRDALALTLRSGSTGAAPLPAIKTATASSRVPHNPNPNPSPRGGATTGWANVPLPRLGFWGSLAATLDTLCPLLIATLTQLRPPTAPPQLRRLITAACVLTVLLNTTRRILPIIRPLQITGLSDTAGQAGLQVGDILLFVDNTAVLNASPAMTQQRLDAGEIGATLELGVLREHPSPPINSDHAPTATLAVIRNPTLTRNPKTNPKTAAHPAAGTAYGRGDGLLQQQSVRGRAPSSPPPRPSPHPPPPPTSPLQSPPPASPPPRPSFSF